MLLLISFIEGAAVMVIELLGAKAIAPYYGTSLYVWGSVLGVTIGALALGYFLGGAISRRYPAGRSLFVLLLAGALCTLPAPWLAPALWPATEALGVRLGSLLAVSIYLLPAVTCLGAVSPVIIQLINRDAAGAGQSTGTVYAISTLGGILATFVAGFYLIPEIGIRVTAVLTGGLLGLFALAYLAVFRRLGSAGSPRPAAALVAPRKVARSRSRGGPAVNAPALTALPAGTLLVIACIEGGAVMVMELLGAKITAPYYGASLYVWASVLAVTLAALATGYLLGGRLSRKVAAERYLFAVLLLAAFLTAIAPAIAPPVLMATDVLGVRAGSLVAVLIYLLPPVACMGMASPLITRLINRNPEEAGQSAGTVYAISTVGGVLATFFAGFYLIPEEGIRITALLTGGVLGGLAIVYFLLTRKPLIVLAACVLAVLVVVVQPTTRPSGTSRLLYNATGILGQWMVLDYGPWPTPDNIPVERRLLLNGIDQTYTQVGFEPLSLWKYPHKIGAYASMKPAGSRALLLGMGGGSIAFELKAMGLDLDIVELDERIRDITQRFFKYDPATSRMYIDDARHFIRQTREKYDVVVIDLLIGEVQPTHVFSLEGFGDLRRILNEDALVIINFQGYMNDREISIAPRSIYRTLQAAGFFVDYYSDPREQTLVQDIFFVASQKKQDYRKMLSDLRYNKWFTFDHFGYTDLIRDDPPFLGDAYILVDDKPRLEVLNAVNILQWRKNKMQEHVRPLIGNGLPIYN